MKKLLILLMLLLFPLSLYSDGYYYASGVSLTCQSLYTLASGDDGNWYIATYNIQQYGGIVFDDGTTGAICQVDWFVRLSPGTPASYDYYTEIWLLDGSQNLDSFVGRSAKVDGNNDWSSEMVSFTFASDVSYDCSGANQYGIFLKAIDDNDPPATVGRYDGTNYITVGKDTNNDTQGAWNQALAYWNSATGAIVTPDTNDDMLMTIYTKQP